MFFNYGNKYILMGLSSEYENPLHNEIAGRICELIWFEPGMHGMFCVAEEDGMHRIRTSLVKDVNSTDFEHDIIITTENSVYTFSMLTYNTEEERNAG